jgi:histidine triad (HIT) family protein
VEDCIFCLISAGEIPAEVVYEDDQVLAFKDISPAAPSHILLIPRRHIATYNDLEPQDGELLGHMALVLKKLAADQGLAENGYRILINCGSEGGQEVYHLHYHLLGGRPLG